MSLEDFSIELIQSNIMETLRTYLYPNATNANLGFGLSDGSSRYNLAQEIKLYSTRGNIKGDARGASSMQVDVKTAKVGSPDGGLIIGLVTDDNGSPSTSTVSSYTIPTDDISPVMSVVSCTLAFDNPLGSNTKYWLKWEPTNSLSATDYFSVERYTSTVDYWLGQGYFNTDGGSYVKLNGDVYFSCSIPNWIYTDYPREDLDRYSYPRISTMISERGDAERPYISKSPVYYTMYLDTIVYSRFPGECNDLCSLVDRVLFDRSTSMSPNLNLRLTTPGRLFPMAMVREYYVRTLRTTARWRMTG